MAMKYFVTGDQYRDIDRRMSEIKRQLNQRDGSALDPFSVTQALQQIIEGNFGGGNAVTIDCDAPIPEHLVDGFTRREKDQISSRVCGTISVDPANPFRTVLVDGQECGAVTGEKVLEELRCRNAPVYGIAALEQMRQEGLIPDSLKGQAIFAWGDVLRGGDGSLYVRYLDWNGGEWHWLYRWIDGGWDSNDPAAVRAS